MKKFAHHILVCTNQKSEIGEKVAKEIKSGVKALKVKNALLLRDTPRIRVQPVGCLGNCDDCKKGSGAAVVVYPAGTWYGNVRPTDAAEIVDQHLRQGRVVARLQIKE